MKNEEVIDNLLEVTREHCRLMGSSYPNKVRMAEAQAEMDEARAGVLKQMGGSSANDAPFDIWAAVEAFDMAIRLHASAEIAAHSTSNRLTGPAITEAWTVPALENLKAKREALVSRIAESKPKFALFSWTTGTSPHPTESFVSRHKSTQEALEAVKKLEPDPASCSRYWDIINLDTMKVCHGSHC